METVSLQTALDDAQGIREPHYVSTSHQLFLPRNCQMVVKRLARSLNNL